MPQLTKQPIKFLLYQLTTNELNIKRFNSLGKIYLKIENNEILFWTTEHKSGYTKYWWTFDMLRDEHIELFIHSCLSRVNGEAVLGLFEYVSGSLYKSFGDTLYQGHPLYNTALSTLHDKMLEFVPEYKEFLKYK